MFNVARHPLCSLDVSHTRRVEGGVETVKLFNNLINALPPLFYELDDERTDIRLVALLKHLVVELPQLGFTPQRFGQQRAIIPAFVVALD
jgi:hypothetical protein